MENMNVTIGFMILEKNSDDKIKELKDYFSSLFCDEEINFKIYNYDENLIEVLCTFKKPLLKVTSAQKDYFIKIKNIFDKYREYTPFFTNI